MSLPKKKRKYPKQREKQPNEIKRILNTKMSAKGGPVFTFSLPWGAARSLAPGELRH